MLRLRWAAMLPAMKRRSALLLATAGLALRPALAAGGPSAQDLNWTDANRQRSLPLRLRLPVGQGAVPLVLFSHGLGGSVDAGTQWAETWARAGIATLHLQHPGSDSDVIRNGGPRALREAANAKQLQARCADVRFVLDELARRAAEPGFQRLRLDAVGLAGHSFGAHTTLAIAGQSFGRAGAPLADPRPRAFAAFSPSPGDAGRSDAADAFGGIRRPVLCLTGSLDGDPLGLAARTDASRADSGQWRRAVYEALPAGDKAELWLDGADHMSFSGQDLPRRMARLRPRPEAAAQQVARHRALIESRSTLWWKAQLLNDGVARAELAQAPAQLLPQDAWRRA
jgi:predicted dienelactone hydrolase